MTLGTDLVILENAVFPLRESQKSLGGKVEAWRGAAIQGKCKQEHKAQHSSLSDVAEAAVMAEKNMSPGWPGAGQ